ncbi:MAG: hypothetical protein KJN77_00790 [Gammaproteobacteria bacterium]|nr:hypothetical protein [Gammaproteobacteria bacterium]
MQRIVLWSGALIGVIGLFFILLLPIGPAWRLLGCVTSLVMISSELYGLRQAFASYSLVRLAHDGTARLLDRDGQWQSAELLPGSLLLRHYGWLRLQPRNGRRFAALFRGHCRHSADWRRLQVIWRHVGANS